MIKVDILILGGGITGLSVASFLTKNKDYLLLEKENTLGGYCKTTIRNGYIWDYSGHFFHFKNENIKNKLIKNIKGKVSKISKISKVFYNGKYINFPFQNNIDKLDKNEFIECLVDLFFSTELKHGEGFKDFVYGKLGKSISEKFIIPYNEKLYSCDLNKLDYDCMGRFFPRTTFSDVMNNIKGLKNSSYNDEFIYPERGAQEFVESISSDLDQKKIKKDEEVLNIDVSNKIVTTSKNTYSFNKLVSTLSFKDFLKLTNEDSSKLKSNKVVVFNIGFDRKSDNNFHWIYFPSNEIFYRVGFYDNILGSNKMSLYIEIGLDQNEKIDEINLFSKVIEDLKKVNIIKKHKVVDYQMLVLNPAYVHITKESKLIYENWCQENNKNDIYSIGRYGSWTYCSIEDNIIQAQEISKKL
jgi:protoporphyrinogen oxidase